MRHDIHFQFESANGAALRNPPADPMQAIRSGAAAFPPIGASAQAKQIDALIKAGAWTDAALAMIRINAPDWTVRRLEIDDGEWFCSLSRHASVPLDFDDRVEGRHRLLPVAILAALSEARLRSAAESIDRGSETCGGRRGVVRQLSLSSRGADRQALGLMLICAAVTVPVVVTCIIAFALKLLT